jgi:hypothetical protein
MDVSEGLTIFSFIVNVRIKAVCFSETLKMLSDTTQCYNQRDWIIITVEFEREKTNASLLAMSLEVIFIELRNLMIVIEFRPTNACQTFLQEDSNLRHVFLVQSENFIFPDSLNTAEDIYTYKVLLLRSSMSTVKLMYPLFYCFNRLLIPIAFSAIFILKSKGQFQFNFELLFLLSTIIFSSAVLSIISLGWQNKM